MDTSLRVPMAEPSPTTPVAAAAPERARLLATKRPRPRPRAGFLARPRRWGRLDQGRAGALTLVGAPAGFGKTSLLGDWARRGRRPVAWLSLDEADRDPARFWRSVAAALDGPRPGVAQRVEALFQGGQPPPEAVLAVLVNELAAAPEEVVLVLDDYHLVEAPPVHQSAGPRQPAAALGRLAPQQQQERQPEPTPGLTGDIANVQPFPMGPRPQLVAVVIPAGQIRGGREPLEIFRPKRRTTPVPDRVRRSGSFALLPTVRIHDAAPEQPRQQHARPSRCWRSSFCS
jgi:hypothetical protein